MYMVQRSFAGMQHGVREQGSHAGFASYKTSRSQTRDMSADCPQSKKTNTLFEAIDAMRVLKL